MDDNDSNGAISSPPESFADIIANLRLHESCVGRGFYWNYDRGCGQWICPNNPNSTGYYCDGYGDCCLSCTGVRDSDYNQHVSRIPHRPDNFICPTCSTGSGPCGKNIYCESAIPSEAIWDLAARDLQSPPFTYDKQTAFEIATRLTYLASGNITYWYSCNCPNTSDGCSATNGYMQYLAADDDNGDISDGTPHMIAIYNAFNRHGIACSTPAPTNSGCIDGPTSAPLLSGQGGNYNISLNWSSEPAASKYYVLRTEGIKGCDFGKIKIAEVSGTNYIDTQVMNGRTYYYTIMPVGSNSACLGPLSNCVSVMPTIPPGRVLNSLIISKVGTSLQLNWSAPGGTCIVSGYELYRGTLPWTGYNHDELDCNITITSITIPQDSGSYYYLIVPKNSTYEGSYGLDSNGNQIPQAQNTPCSPQETTNCN